MYLVDYWKEFDFRERKSKNSKSKYTNYIRAAFCNFWNADLFTSVTYITRRSNNFLAWLVVLHFGKQDEGVALKFVETTLGCQVWIWIIIFRKIYELPKIFLLLFYPGNANFANDLLSRTRSVGHAYRPLHMDLIFN